jgi:hypothetical protein
MSTCLDLLDFHTHTHNPLFSDTFSLPHLWGREVYHRRKRPHSRHTATRQTDTPRRSLGIIPASQPQEQPSGLLT